MLMLPGLTSVGVGGVWVWSCAGASAAARVKKATINVIGKRELLTELNMFDLRKRNVTDTRTGMTGDDRMLRMLTQTQGSWAARKTRACAAALVIRFRTKCASASWSALLLPGAPARTKRQPRWSIPAAVAGTATRAIPLTMQPPPVGVNHLSPVSRN